MAWFLAWCATGAAPTLIVLAAANRAMGLAANGPILPASALAGLIALAGLAHALGIRAILAGLTRHRLEVWPDRVVLRRDGLSGSDESIFPLGDRQRLGAIVEVAAVHRWGGRPHLDLRILRSHALGRVRIAMPDLATAESAAALIAPRLGTA